MRKFLFAVMSMALAWGLGSCKPKADVKAAVQPKVERTLSIGEFEKVIADSQKVVLLDVRTEKEYNEGHLKGARQIDVKKNDFRTRCVAEIPVSKVIAVYCRSGFRSKTAARILAEQGYDVVNMDGGITAWTAAGKEIVK